MKPANAGTIVASYGSVSAGTFVRATSFLDFVSQGFSGHMIAVMALMEALAIIIGLLLINYFRRNEACCSSYQPRPLIAYGLRYNLPDQRIHRDLILLFNYARI